MEMPAFESLSSELTATVERLAASVVRVEGRRRSAASGLVWSADGVIVTAHHALERDEEIEVGLPTGDVTGGEVIGRDPTTDLAALRVRASGLAPVDWPAAPGPALAPGVFVLGITRPGRTARAGLGVVARAAGEWRAPRGGRIDRWIETSLDLHRGLSGGLAATAAGAPIGLLSAGLARGTALVLPAETLRRVVKSLLAHGEVRRGWLGVATTPVRLPANLREQTGEEVALLVTGVEHDSPAERAGLLFADAILAFGGERLQDPGALFALLAEDRIGDAVALRVLRAGQAREVTVTVGARPGRRP
jgi:S1-C subfamily serine protease